MANKTISDLEQVAALTDNLKFACEGNEGNTSSVTMGQMLEFLHAPVVTLQVSGSAPNYVLNPQTNKINLANLSNLLSTHVVNINLPAGNLTRETQIILKINNPNLATIRIPQLAYRLSMLNLTIPNFQLILDYDQVQGAWVGGTLSVEAI